MADPMYRQIAEDLRRQIESGELPPGSQLPTEIELREKYNASRNTIRDAIKWLITRGLIEIRPGQGTFVPRKVIPFITTLTGDPGSGFPEGDPYKPGHRAGGGEGEPYYAQEVIAWRREPTATEPTVEIRVADSHLAAELELPAGTTVISRHQRRYIDGIPWSLQTSFYPLAFVERGADALIKPEDILGGTVAYLRKVLGIKQVGWRDVIAVRPPDAVESAFFELPDDGHVAVIETRRTAFDENGSAVRLTRTAYPADRNEFAVSIGTVPDRVVAPPTVVASPTAEGDRSPDL
jgi:GntR family transcriptional regulator